MEKWLPVNVKDQSGEIVKLIQHMSARHSVWQVFSDWVEIMALSISNAVDWAQRAPREERYLEIVKQYSKEEIDTFAEMFGLLIAALDDKVRESGPEDLLGPIFHALELHNKYKGQFFTPVHICEFMAKITSKDYDPDIKKNGFVSVGEPYCGSGAMVLAFAKAMKEDGYNYCSQMVTGCKDVDLKCVCMTYVQLSLCGIPAVVIHGNTLLMQEWSRWYTPVYVIDGWARKWNGSIKGMATTKKEERQKPKYTGKGPGFIFFFEEGGKRK